MVEIATVFGGPDHLLRAIGNFKSCNTLLRNVQMFDMNNSPIPSGIYLCQPLVLQTIQVTNPFFPGASPVEPQEIAVGEDAKKLYASAKQSQDCFVVNRPIVMDYAVELVRAARLIREREYDLVLCPLRGARLPGIQARVMADNADNFRSIDGTGMAQGSNDARILRELREIIFSTPGKSEPRQLGVLDTAKGGDSCHNMARLLSLLNKESEQEWGVRFHLLHAADRTPPRATQAYSYGSQTFQVEIDYHPVADLLIEDEPALLGYDITRQGSQSFSHRLQQDGSILYRDREKATLFRKAPLDETMIGIVTDEVSHHIQGLPDAQLIDPERWKAHKGP